jgi:hypothetical protein
LVRQGFAEDEIAFPCSEAMRVAKTTAAHRNRRGGVEHAQLDGHSTLQLVVIALEEFHERRLKTRSPMV